MAILLRFPGFLAKCFIFTVHFVLSVNKYCAILRDVTIMNYYPKLYLARCGGWMDGWMDGWMMTSKKSS